MLLKLKIVAFYLFVYCRQLNAIYDGELVTQSQIGHPFPYHATVEVYNRPEDLDCSGVIIRNDLVVTVAHCLRCQERKNLKVRAGHFEYRQNATTGSTVQERNVKKFIIKEDFSITGNAENDIALIWLETKFTLNEFVNVIQMATIKETVGSRNKTAETCGIGYLEDGSRSKYLLKTKLQIGYVRNECLIFQSTDPYFKRKSICTLSPNNHTGPCRGDSGGPLVIEKDGSPLLLGITSWGHVDYTNTAKCIPIAGYAFTGIAFFRSWITHWMAELI